MRAAGGLVMLGAVAVAACREAPDPRSCIVVASGAVSRSASSPDDDTVHAEAHLVRDVPPRAPDGAVHVVIEIPAGTNAKFEVGERDGALHWERRSGARRVVDYLPYPASYGFVPGTLSDAGDGGDGDPLDAFVLGPAIPRGEVVEARVVAVLRLLDEGEVDDKLVAVPANLAPDAPFRGVSDLADLRRDYDGVLDILETWLERYDGHGVTECTGVDDATSARRVVDAAIDAYAQRG